MEKFIKLEDVCLKYNSLEEAIKDLCFEGINVEEEVLEVGLKRLRQEGDLEIDDLYGLPRNIWYYITIYEEKNDIYRIKKYQNDGIEIYYSESFCFFKIIKKEK